MAPREPQQGTAATTEPRTAESGPEPRRNPMVDDAFAVRPRARRSDGGPGGEPREGAGATRAATSDGGAPRVRVRMYRQGLGDCFLLTFQPGTDAEAHVLVDMGTIGKGEGGVSMAEVAKDILDETHGRLRAVVATHEHADHLSGFKELAKLGVHADEAWLAWTEDASDPLAKEICKYQGDLFATAEHAARALERQQRDAAAARRADERSAYIEEMNAGLRELWAFHGLEVKEGQQDPVEAMAARDGGLKKTIQQMMADVWEVAGRRARFWSPGDVVEPEWAPGVRFYVLGPPRSAKAIQQLGEHGSPDLYELAFVVKATPPSEKDAPQDREAELSWEPFDEEYMYRFGADAAVLGDVVRAYEAEDWRKIDEATAGAAAELALQLDSTTNNTSLVLAIEVGGEVLLFPGDAQLGSWLTWSDVKFTVRDGDGGRTVRGEELLRRTTFYKVGHHGSHNATSKPGLELMGEGGLTAFIPLDEGVARNRHWPMPARELHARLREKTRGRVLKSDNLGEDLDRTKADEAPFPGVTVDEKYVEITLPATSAARAEPPAGVAADGERKDAKKRATVV